MQSCHAASIAADNRESDSLEHQSGSGDQHSMCRQLAHGSAYPSIKVEAAEGAGETGKHSRQDCCMNILHPTIVGCCSHTVHHMCSRWQDQRGQSHSVHS